jgi:TolB-like protein
MKTMKNITIGIAMTIALVILMMNANAQSKQSIAVLNVDAKGLTLDSETMSNLVRLELQKKDKYEVLDRYEVEEITRKNNIKTQECYSRSCLTSVGKVLNTDYILSGNVDRYGEKIVVVFRLINVNKGVIETTHVKEYLNEQPHIQKMIAISLNDMLGIENDPTIVEQLVNVDIPVASSKTAMKLNGPRMGAMYVSGKSGERLMASKKNGGYEMFPVSSMFGYQFEVQYLSSGDFQALVEVLTTVNGLESGAFVPSFTFMNGLRLNKGGWEIGFGPSIKPIKTISGYYDDGTWTTRYDSEFDHSKETQTQIDRRGDLSLSTGMVFAVGKTIKSGLLNIPVNVYCSPKKKGTTVGVSVGFNVAKRPSSIPE